MTIYPFDVETSDLPNIGLIALQTDETIEPDFHRLIAPEAANLYVSRISCEDEVTSDALATMRSALPISAGLFPKALEFDVIAYGCTSGASVIGTEIVADLIKAKTGARAVTDPVTALLDTCNDLKLKRLAFLSPYVEEVSLTLRDLLRKHGVDTPAFGSFNEADDATVAKIAGHSIAQAAELLCKDVAIDGLFMSCTNLKTLPLINQLSETLGLPVLSSNLVLIRHVAKLTNIDLNGLP